MADLNSLFRGLVDASGLAHALSKMLQGDSPAAKAGAIGFSYRDSSGNVVLPQLTADGKLPVDTEATGGACRTARGENSGSTSMVDVAEITITGGIAAQKIIADVSCFRETHFQIVYRDDADGTPADTVIADCLVGPGQFYYKMGDACLTVDVSGGTGTQKIVVQGQNKNPASGSTMRATVMANDSAGS